MSRALSEGVLPAALAFARAHTDPVSGLDAVLLECPPEVRAWADRVIELPPATAVTRALEVLLGLPVPVGDEHGPT